jgi:hypothetical protein
MPPPRYNPTAVSRARVLDEPYPRVYFPEDRDDPFAPQVESGLALSSTLEMDDLLGQRDNSMTKLAENATRRLELRSRERLLPFTTAAEIARQKSLVPQYEQAEQNAPFIGESQRENALTNIDENRIRREVLPEVTEAERITRSQQKLDFERERQAMETADPHEAALTRVTKDPSDLLAYQTFLGKAAADKKLSTPDAKRRYAYNNALRFARDKEAVAAIEQAALDDDDDGIREQFIEDFRDPETGWMGSRIKADVDPAKLGAMLRKQANRKLQMAREKDEAAQQKSSIDQAIRINGDLMQSNAAEIKAREAAMDAEGAKALREEQATLKAAHQRLLRKVLGDKEPEAPAPAPAAAPSAKPTKTSYIDQAKKAAMED